MSELMGVDSGTPEFDKLVLARYQDFPRIERELMEARQKLTDQRALLARAADALMKVMKGGDDYTINDMSEWLQLIQEQRDATK